MSQFNPSIPQRKPTLNIYSALLAVSVLLLLIGSGWIAWKNIELTSGSNQGGPFEYVEYKGK
ncbi:MAG: hypothetical protein DWH85_01005 [Planctomycetota bacterium]|jgi:hypothetical protein|nr:MAG: hypothetical protein DWH85_01005 [Planctomycetota bacterium]RLT00455.1 MAG: hypothetical protein DWI18_01685 [Planctomycetota bacterium]